MARRGLMTPSKTGGAKAKTEQRPPSRSAGPDPTYQAGGAPMTTASATCTYRNPMGLMTLGRQPDHSQPKYFMHAYNTISEHMLKSSKSNNDLKVTPCTSIPINNDSNYIKRGSWSTLTLSHAREVCQKASATIDKALLKSKSCHQDLAYHYLQPDGGLWAQLGGVSPASSWAPQPLGWEDTGAVPLQPS
ncbi:PREDICTED: disks large-associated protein 4-like, partial [Chlamydotis macqueenii]|uniref:disks large-associated protein 4-like n=1 Tax=Chlamydotis macqueenii TaxID=187382 RepID=UPI000529C54E